MPISNIIFLEQMKLKVYFLVNLYLIRFKLERVVKFVDYTNLWTTPPPPPPRISVQISIYRRKLKNHATKSHKRSAGLVVNAVGIHLVLQGWTGVTTPATKQKARLNLPQVCKQKEDWSKPTASFRNGTDTDTESRDSPATSARTQSRVCCSTTELPLCIHQFSVYEQSREKERKNRGHNIQKNI